MTATTVKHRDAFFKVPFLLQRKNSRIFLTMGRISCLLKLAAISLIITELSSYCPAEQHHL
jgi:hypothetical protein